MFRSATLITGMLVATTACSDSPTASEPGPSSVPTAIAVVSGDNQVGVVGRPLPEPLIVRVTNARAQPVRHVVVAFQVDSGNGAIVSVSGSTDSLGVVRALWRLGTSAASTQLLHVTIVRASGPRVEFRARATAGSPAAISIVGPLAPTVDSAAEFDRQVVVRVHDAFNNPVPGVRVGWSVSTGALDADISETDADGSAVNRWTVRGANDGLLEAGVYRGSAEVSANPSLRTVFGQAVGDARLEAVALVSGSRHSCAVAVTSGVFCWGDNSLGQLGNGSSESGPFAVRVEESGSLTRLAAGAWHTCALTPSGQAYCWGSNGDGQLGDGTRWASSRPIAVATDLRFASLGGGTGHTCGLTGDGTAYCWGVNSVGQLGDGTLTSRLTPVRVATSLTFASIAVGADHTCGLTRDHEVYCWGNGAMGELGAVSSLDSVCAERCAVTPVLAGGGFDSIVAGLDYTCGLDASGAAWCWGGYLPATERVVTDVPFAALTAATGESACGLTEVGVAYCWWFFPVASYEPQVPPTATTYAGPLRALGVGDDHACWVDAGPESAVVCRATGAADSPRPEPVLRAARP